MEVYYITVQCKDGKCQRDNIIIPKCTHTYLKNSRGGFSIPEVGEVTVCYYPHFSSREVCEWDVILVKEIDEEND